MNLQKYSLSTQKPYSKIFWPIRCNDKKSGYLIGWNTRSFVACVVDIISDISLQDLEIILRELSYDKRMLTCPVGQPKILGEWVNKNAANGSNSLDSCNTYSTNSSSGNSSSRAIPNNLHDVDIWISLERSSDYGQPCLKKIYCNEYKFQTSSQIVLYDDTSPYYYTSTPISLIPSCFKSNSSLIDKSTMTQKSNNMVFSPVTNSSSTSSSTLSPTSMNKFKQSASSSDLESTFKQINCSSDIKTILNETIEKYYKSTNNKNPLPSLSIDTKPNSRSLFTNSFFGLRNRKINKSNSNSNIINIQNNNNNSNSNNNNQVSNSNNNRNNNNESKLKKYMFAPLYLVMIILKLFEKILTKILNMDAPFLKNKKLKDLTTLGGLLDSRIDEIKLIVKQYHHVKDKKYWLNNNQDRALLIEYKNRCWLLVNDIALGICAGILLNFLSSYVLTAVSNVNYMLTNDFLKNLILWLMGWPAGFKLNENLDKFFGRLILYYIDKWNLITTTIAPHGGVLLTIVCACGCFGISVLVSVIIDLFSIFTLHISVFYSVSARFYLLQLMLLKSLWNLFRGVKYNPLRKRTDSCDFDQYQLLLGTLMFTLIFFLFPTTAIYYFFFAIFKSSLTVVMALFSLLLHLLRTFPLFGMLVYLIDKKYLPNGVNFTVKNNENTNNLKKNDYLATPTTTIQSPILTTTMTTTTPTITPSTTITTAGSNNNTNNKPSSPLLFGQSISTVQTPNQQHMLLSPKTGLGHRRNQSLSSSTSSPIGPRVSTQLEITYVHINIEPIKFLELFSHTISLVQGIISFYNPSKLFRSFFLGVPVHK